MEEIDKVFNKWFVNNEKNKFIIYSSYFIPVLSFEINDNKIEKIIFTPFKLFELSNILKFFDLIYYNNIYKLDNKIIIDIVNLDNTESFNTFNEFIISSNYFNYIYLTSSFEYIYLTIDLINSNPYITNIIIFPSISDNIKFINNINNIKIDFNYVNNNHFLIFAIIILINFSIFLFI